MAPKEIFPGSKTNPFLNEPGTLKWEGNWQLGLNLKGLRIMTAGPLKMGRKAQNTGILK